MPKCYDNCQDLAPHLASTRCPGWRCVVPVVAVCRVGCATTEPSLGLPPGHQFRPRLFFDFNHLQELTGGQYTEQKTVADQPVGWTMSGGEEKDEHACRWWRQVRLIHVGLAPARSNRAGPVVRRAGDRSATRYLWHYKDIMIGSKLLYRLAVPNPKKMHLERFVGEVFFNYIHLVRDPMLKKYPDELEELKPFVKR
uniref:Uncharacterized protein n=1 Tax=Globodera rostochiensis TaxID=31243 RepID=A0A914HSC5_GLORO